MASRPLARLAVLTAVAAAALAPMAAAAADADLPDGLHCDVLDCRNDTDHDYAVSGTMQCEYTDTDGSGSSVGEDFADIVPAHSLYRLSGCLGGQSPYLRSIDWIR
ncbi:hypothetical protein KHQ06_22280 [Nocardia tengchongensis]|uniref:Uncharacterized protein n=1 Tax=Nocardia tengchongensis TaxID=2055889 RepID=A0ABX8CGT6_9NOCA|nr:hypothetical protein [Nocardia tengchongensis]QVI19174.1 hypothetical protein KHQ06_22280 [Nocardia tengchongensis]